MVFNIYVIKILINIYLHLHGDYMRAHPPKWNLFIKNCAFILTCLNFSHLQSMLHLMQYTHQNFFPLLETVFKLFSFVAF